MTNTIIRRKRYPAITVQDNNLTSPEIDCLVALNTFDELSMLEIASVMKIHWRTVKLALRYLQQCGYVRRIKSGLRITYRMPERMR